VEFTDNPGTDELLMKEVYENFIKMGDDDGFYQSNKTLDHDPTR